MFNKGRVMAVKNIRFFSTKYAIFIVKKMQIYLFQNDQHNIFVRIKVSMILKNIYLNNRAQNY